MGRQRIHPPKNSRDIIRQLAATGGEPIGMAAELGVSLEIFQRWLIERPALQHAFDLGRDEERHALHASVLQAAKDGKTAGARNAMFLLSSRHAALYKEIEPTEVSIERDSHTNVLTVIDHGSDDNWERLASKQQSILTQAVTITHERPTPAPPLPLARPAALPYAVAPPPQRALPSWYPRN